jgi:hypothetical protein
MKALSRLTWGGSTAVGLTTHDIHDNERSVDHQSMPGEFTNFNEQLMLGYFEGSRISVSLSICAPLQLVNTES